MDTLRNIQPIPNLPFSIKPWIDITDQLPSRNNDPEPRRTLKQITHISVHHSGVEGGTPQGYADYHVNTKKWYHIGYHTVISASQTYQTNDFFTFSYHTSGQNDYTVSVSVSGDFTKRDLTEVERKNLYAAILTFMSIFNIGIENVLGHDEFPNQSTECPGFDMNIVRDDVRGLWNVIQSADTWDRKNTKVNELANQYKYMFDFIQVGESDGNAKWAMEKLLGVRDTLIEKGLL